MAVMTGTGRGFALALAMLIGALSVTSLLALGLQGHAVQHQPSADFSPTKDALVDPAGWPREAQPEPQPESSSTPRVGQGRSRLPAASSDSGA
jgi:hypothetical protein